MKNLTWNESLDLISPHFYTLVTSISGAGKPNIMGLSWWTFVNWKPQWMAIAVGSKSQSCSNIKEIKQFAVCFPPEDQARGAWICGTKSGKKIDKFKEAGLGMIYTDSIKPPIIGGSVVAYTCKVIDQKEMKDHCLFIGEITDIYSDTEFKKHLYSVNYKKIVSIDMEGDSDFDIDFK